ncbi:MAG: type IV secretion system DNA-binding domain-containing protein [Cyanobacteria bacterium J06621_8]
MTSNQRPQRQLEDNIPWYGKLRTRYLQHQLKHKPLGNWLLTFVAIGSCTAITSLTLPKKDTIIQLAQEDATTEIQKAEIGEAVRYNYRTVIFLMALVYFLLLTPQQRKFTCQGEKARQKYWLYLMAQLIVTITSFGADFIAGLAISNITGFILLSRIPKEEVKVLRGFALKPQLQVKGEYNLLATEEDLKSKDGYPFGGVMIPPFSAVKNFIFFGMVGSGKSISIKLLMIATLPKIKPGSNCRSLIYDHSQDILQELHGMGIDCPAYLLNSFDERGYTIDWARDFTDPEDVEALAEIFIPTEQNKKDDFFDTAARELFKGVVEVFNATAPGEWTLRDVLVALFSESIIFALLDTPDQRWRLELLGGKDNSAAKQKAGVLASLVTKLGKFKTLAALMFHHWSEGRTISLLDWSTSESILVMGSSNKSDVAMSLLNSVIFHRICEILLDLPEIKPQRPQTSIFFDELPALGYQRKLSPLLLKGRKRNVMMVAGAQSKASLDKIYTKETTEELLGQFLQKSFLKLADVTTSQYAHTLYGRQLVEEKSKDENNHLQTSTYWRDVVMPSELLDITAINVENNIGLTGYYLGESAFKYTYKLPKLWDKLTPSDKTVENFIPADSQYKKFRFWSGEDIERLGIAEILRQQEIGKAFENFDWDQLSEKDDESE